MFRNILLDRRGGYLEIKESVPVDDQFSSPKQCNWSAALGKVLIADYGNSREMIRNPDLSFYDKYVVSQLAGVDADSTNVYLAQPNWLLKHGLGYSATHLATLNINSIRMIDAQSDPDYVYVTSNNATDGHGVRMIRKSDMTVVASLLATGSGDGQFNNPLGIKKYGNYVYVCDTGNNRVVVLNASDLSYSSKYDVAFAIQDIVTDGSYWYSVAVDGTLRKRDMSFSSPNVAVISSSGYSLCIIPDDGINGATLCVVSSTNSNIKRHKCSDLSLITTVGSSGDGSSSLFDPTFTTSVTTTMTYKSDDGIVYTTPAGTSHALSMNGFAAAFHRTAGPHRWQVRCAAGLGAITEINIDTDAITGAKNLSRATNLTNFYGRNNGSGMQIPLSSFPKSYTRFDTPSSGGISGGCADFARTCTYIDIGGSSPINGDPSGLPPAITRFYGNGCALSGLTSAFPATLLYLYLYGCTSIIAASIAHLVAIRDLRIYSMGWDQTAVDLVIDSAYQARASYTYASTIAMNIGGTNANPSGTDPMTDPTVTPGAGSSNADWQWNAGLGHHVPLTGLAKAYVLQNDPFGEGHKLWAITY